MLATATSRASVSPWLSWLQPVSLQLFSRCNHNSLFQPIISPTSSFALASTFLSLIFQAWFLSDIKPSMHPDLLWVGQLVISSLPAPGNKQPWGIKALSPCPRLYAQWVGHCKSTAHKYLVQIISKTRIWKADCQNKAITHNKTKTNNYLTSVDLLQFMGLIFPNSAQIHLFFIHVIEVS